MSGRRHGLGAASARAWIAAGVAAALLALGAQPAAAAVNKTTSRSNTQHNVTLHAPRGGHGRHRPVRHGPANHGHPSAALHDHNSADGAAKGQATE